jgi:type IV pilus assembly protein PilP
VARRLSVWLLAGALAAACGGDDPEAQKTAAAKPKAQKSVQAAKAGGGEVADQEYRYDPTGKPDPFKSFVQKLKRDSVAGKSTPLERFDLSQLRLSGIIWGDERPRALIKDPSGKAYIVAEGSPIGKNDGRVIRIDDNQVMVKETYVDFMGKATTKDIQMKLHERQGG